MREAIGSTLFLIVCWQGMLVSAQDLSSTLSQESTVQLDLLRPNDPYLTDNSGFSGQLSSRGSSTKDSEIYRLREQLQSVQAELESLKANSPFQLSSWQDNAGSDVDMSAGNSGASGGNVGDLAAKSQNPVSDLVSLPFQSNFSFGNQPGNRLSFIGNLQPVIPVKLNDNWNLVNRLILPIVNVPVGPVQRSDGLGDSILQFFFSPRNAKELIWGIGPSVLLPTASDQTLGVQEWGAGVNGVVLVNRKPMLYGALINQGWSFAGGTKPFLLQPFFNYNFKKGWFFTSSGELNADWERPSDRRYSFPFGAGIGRVFPLFGQPVSVSTRFGPYLIKPPNSPDWEFRLAIVYLFPK